MSNEKHLKKLVEIVKDIKTGMLVTQKGDQLYSRPMYTAQIEDDGTIWFFSHENSGKMDAVKDRSTVLLTYTENSSHTFLSVSGSATAVQDRAKVKELWNPMFKAWFPEGVNDDEIVLIKVTPEKAEYWDGADNRLVQLFKIGIALLKGEKHESQEHKKMTL